MKASSAWPIFASIATAGFGAEMQRRPWGSKPKPHALTDEAYSKRKKKLKAAKASRRRNRR